MTNYEDNTTILVNKTNYPDLITEASDIFNRIKEWFNKNNLITNADKTTTKD